MLLFCCKESFYLIKLYICGVYRYDMKKKVSDNFSAGHCLLNLYEFLSVESRRQKAVE